jgi:plastocyanin
MVVAAGVLAGCGSGGGATATPSVDPALGRVTTAADGVQQLTLQLQDDYVFTPRAVSVHAGRVRLTVRNAARSFTHAFRFPPGGPQPIAAEIPVLPPGQQRTIEFEVTTPGSYRFECSLHVQAGQVGTMTVGG